MSLFHASTCFEHHVLIARRSKLYYTASGIVTLKQVSGLKLLKYNSISMNKYEFYHYVFILKELYFSNFSYFSNFRPLTCFSVMIPEAV